MTKSMVRSALFSSVSFLAPLVTVLLPKAALAQTVCTPTPTPTQTQISCVDGANTVVTGSTDTTTTVNPAVQGLSTTSAGNQTTTLNPGPDGDTISTNLLSTPGIIANSGGSLTLTAGSVNVHTTAPISNAVDLTGTSISTSLGNLTTDGTGSDGIVTNSTGNTTLTVGDISGLHNGGIGAFLTTTGSGNLDFSAGNIAVGFGQGLNATVGGSSTITVDDVSSAFSGITVTSSTGSIDLTSGNVSAIGSNAVSLSTAGAITYSGGDLSTQAADSVGLLINGGAGAIDVTVGDVSTQGLNSTGIDITGTSSIAIDSGNVSTAAPITDAVQLTGGTGSDGVVTNSTGDTTLTVGDISGLHNGGTAANLTTTGSGDLNFTVGNVTTGFGLGVVANVGGNATVTTGNVSVAGGDGVSVNTTTGSISVTSGAITTAAGDGIQTTSTTGNQTITVGGDISAGGAGNHGVNATATSGNIAINVTGGNVTTSTTGTSAIFLNSNGAQTVTIAAGRTVSAAGTTGTPGFAIFGTGPTLLVNNSGTLGTQVDGFAVFTGGVTTSTINNLAGGTMNGRVDLGTLVTTNDVVNNAGTWNTASLNRFYAGADAVNNLSGGVINTASGTTFDSLGTFNNAGTLNTTGTLGFTDTFTIGEAATNLSNSGTINLGVASSVSGLGNYSGTGTINAGAGSSMAGAGTFGNAGTINLNGPFALSGFTSVANTGRINLNTFTLTGPAIAFNNAGTIDTNGSAGIAGFTTMSNSGTLDLAAGTFTVPAALFTNSGTIIANQGLSTITGQTGFANSGTIDLTDGATNDILTINSDFVGSGASDLVIDAGSNAADRLVITGAASGTTTLDVNGVGTIITTPVLVVDTGTSTAGAFVLGSNAANPLIDMTLTRTGEDFFLTSAPNLVAFQPLQVGLVVPDMWYQSADAYTNYAALRRGDIADDGASGFSIWIQGYANRDRYGHEDVETVFGNSVLVDNRIHAGRHGLQAGVDYAPSGTLFAFGVTGGYEHAHANHRSLDGEVRAHAFDVGLYAQYGAPVGFYATLLAKEDWSQVHLTNRAFAIDTIGTPDAKSTGFEGEVGYRWHPTGAAVEVGAGLAYVHTSFDNFSSNGIDYDFDSSKSLRAKIGGRATLTSNSLRPFFDARLYHEFDGDADVTLLSGTVSDTVEANGRGTWGRLEAGIGGSGALAGTLAGWVDLGEMGLGVFYWEPAAVQSWTRYALGALDASHRFTAAMEAFRH